MTWPYDPDSITTTLEAAGFDVDTSAAELPGGGGSITARRDRGSESSVLVINSGGEVRLTVTQGRDQTETRAIDVAGATMSLIVSVNRQLTVQGAIETDDQLEMLASMTAANIVTASAPPPEPAAEEDSADLPWWAREEQSH